MRLEKLNLSFIHLIFLAMTAIALRPTLLRAVPKAVAFRGQAVSFVNAMGSTPSTWITVGLLVLHLAHCFHTGYSRCQGCSPGAMRCCLHCCEVRIRSGEEGALMMKQCALNWLDLDRLDEFELLPGIFGVPDEALLRLHRFYRILFFYPLHISLL